MSLKIGIVGNYGHNNNGDEAILTGILNQINHIDNSCDITIFSDNPADMKERYSLKANRLKYKKQNKITSIIYTLFKVYKNLKDIDLLIIGGGQLLMDLYKRAPLLYCMYSVMGKLAGSTVVYYCVGAGPIKTFMGKFFIGIGLRNSKFVSVRDEQSRKILDEKYGIGDKVVLASDPAFFLNNEIENKIDSNKVRTVGFTTLPYYNKAYWPKENMLKYNAYISTLHKVIDKMLEHTDYNIILFSTVYKADTISATDLFDTINNKSRVANNTDNLKPYELIEVINKCDLIVGTRLHSLILSVVCEKPIVGINYQPKVRNFMERVHLNENCFNIDILNTDIVYEKILSILEDEYDIQKEKSKNALKTMREDSTNSLKSLTQIIRNAKYD